ncbi:hypothetical protein ABFS83_14G144000 [Erythranthe nasuta]
MAAAATRATALCLIAAALLMLITAAAAASDTYTNHTVGGDAGWFFDSTTNKTSADYNAWSAKQTFNLGDYLIFNTNTNQSVIQTYNKTTFASCSIDDSLDTDTFVYDSGSDGLGNPTVVSVPLTIASTQYYFSAAGDGIHCRHGMAFTIKVATGLGLPPNLNQPPPPPYAPPPGPADEGPLPPVPVVTTRPNGGVRTGGGSSFLWLCLVVIVLL